MVKAGQSRLGGEDQEFSLRLAKFEMSVKHPGREMILAVGYTVLGFSEVWAKD